MIYLIFLLTGAILGILTGGHVRNYAQFKVSAYSLLFVFFLIDFFFNHSISNILLPLPHGIVVLLLFIQYGALFQFVIYNARVRPLLLIGLGELLNFLVIMLNDGRMPVSTLALTNGNRAHALASGEILHYSLMTANTHLALLADQIRITFPVPYLFSAGDIVIMIGLLILGFCYSREIPHLKSQAILIQHAQLGSEAE